MYLALYNVFMAWCLSFISAYVVLYAFKYLYDDTQARTYILYIFTYLIYAFIWHLLSALHTFYGSNAALLLYDTHSFCELALVLSFAHTHVSTYTHILYSLYICFHATDSTIFLIHYTNYLIVFVLSRDIFYLCSIYTAKIAKFVQRIICKRTKEKAWHTLQTFAYTISLYKYYTLKQLFCLYFLFFFYVFIYSSILATSDFVAMQVKANIKIFSKSIDIGSIREYNKVTVKSNTKKVANVGLHPGGGKDGIS